MADLEYTIADGIGTILLNRPRRKNAFTLEMIDEWARILTEARTDPDVRVIVLTGDFIDAEEAARLGIANHVVDDDDLPAAVNTLARKLADAPPLRVNLDIFNNAALLDLGTANPSNFRIERFGPRSR